MKTSKILYIIPVFLVASVLFAFNYNSPKETYVPIATAEFNADKNKENFNKMMDVLSHKRCVNCHPNDNIPKQGEDSHPHYFGMARGKDNHGFEAIKCNTCHQAENNDFSGVPGDPEWSLAPHSMRWEGLTKKEIAESMLDKNRNGGRTNDETMHHLTEHALVLWAWNPGISADGTPREKPPVPLEEYKKAVKQWFADGAVIPED